jgi:hypothetical protein
VAEIVGKDPAVDYVNSTVGVGGPNPTTNSGRLPSRSQTLLAASMSRNRSAAE